MPGRAANDVGYQLKNAIPEKFRYLLANVDIDNYTEMMAILERKFGGNRKVVDAAVSDLEKLKAPTTDKEFVRFVESIESVKRDLEALDLVAEVANATVIAKIELRLPPLVKTKWAEKHVEEEFSDKTSTEVFTELMKFLEKNKRSAEYIVSEVRSDGAKHSSTTLVTGGAGRSRSDSGGSEDDERKDKDARKKGRDEKKEGDERRGRMIKPCLACWESGEIVADEVLHYMESCQVW